MHPPGHDKTFWDTSNGMAFGYGTKKSEAELTKGFNFQAGLSKPRPMENQSVRITSGLMSETYKTGEPQASTDVQRSWLP